MKEQVTTKTHYVDAKGQHELPYTLQRRRLRIGSIVAHRWPYWGEIEANEVNDVCRTLGIETEQNDNGDLIITALN